MQAVGTVIFIWGMKDICISVFELLSQGCLLCGHPWSKSTDGEFLSTCIFYFLFFKSIFKIKYIICLEKCSSQLILCWLHLISALTKSSTLSAIKILFPQNHVQFLLRFISCVSEWQSYKEKQKERGEREREASYICWFSPQMDTIIRAGLIRSQDPNVPHGYRIPMT